MSQAGKPIRHAPRKATVSLSIAISSWSRAMAHPGGPMSIWTILFVVLLIAWIGGFTVFHVAGGLIHLLLVFAVISLILHFVMGARTT
jgi:hypothetical protein